MKSQTYNDIVTPQLSEGAITNNEFPGFKDDYTVLHCLIRQHKPRSFFECGTNFGTGTKIIKNAIGENAVVFSMDLPTELIHQSLQPSPDKKTDKVGSNCNLPFVQIRGDSLTFDFSQYPCEGYYVDDNHTYENVYRETVEILKLMPTIVIFHDANIPEVLQGIVDAYKHNLGYHLYRVTDTRVAYLLKIK